MRQIAYYIFCSFLLVSFGCKNRPDAANIKHTFAQTRNERTKPLQACKSDDSEPSKYLQKIMFRLAAANPETFKDVYGIEYFCVSLTQEKALNAMAFPETGNIEFFKDLLKAATTDAAIAAILAHEMAHVTMQSKLFAHEKLRSNPAVNDAQSKLTHFDESHKLERESYERAISQSTYDVDECDNALTRSVTPDLAAEVEKLSAVYMKLFDQQENLNFALAASYTKFVAILKSDAGKALPADERERRRIQYIQENDAKSTQIKELQKQLDAISETIKTKQAVAAAKQANMDVPAFLKSLADKRLLATQKRAANQNRLNALNDQRAELNGMYTKLVFSLVSADEQENWTEQEADEVGFELYLRAGFHPVYFSWLQERLLGNDLEGCRSQLKLETSDPLFRIKRGVRDHPADCWRLYDNQVLEKKRHADDYKAFIDKANSVTILPGELARVKALLP